MKSITWAVMVAVVLSCFCGALPARGQSSDQCENNGSNVEIGRCFAKKQLQVNAKADLLAQNISADFRKLAHGSATSDVLRKAAVAVIESQKSWKVYRDRHCRAVEYSRTTGSGAEIAYQSCMLRLGLARLRELKTDFIAEVK